MRRGSPSASARGGGSARTLRTDRESAGGPRHRQRPSSRPRGRADGGDGRAGRGCRGRSRRHRPSGRCGARRRTGGARSPGTDIDRPGPVAPAGPPAGSSGFSGRRSAACRRARPAQLARSHMPGGAPSRARSRGRPRPRSCRRPRASPRPESRWPASRNPRARAPGSARRPCDPRIRLAVARARPPRAPRGTPRWWVRRAAQTVPGRRFRGTARLDGGARSRGTVPLLVQLLGFATAHVVQGVASRLQRPKEERSVDGRQLRLQAKAAVVIVPVPAHEAPALLLVGLGRRDPPRGPDHPLELGSGRVPRELQELGLALRDRRRG